MRRDQIEALGVPRLLDVLDYHSSVQDAARTAARAGVGTLVLTILLYILIPKGFFPVQDTGFIQAITSAGPTVAATFPSTRSARATCRMVQLKSRA